VDPGRDWVRGVRRRPRGRESPKGKGRAVNLVMGRGEPLATRYLAPVLICVFECDDGVEPFFYVCVNV
jgi:hypothetical protein